MSRRRESGRRLTGLGQVLLEVRGVVEAPDRPPGGADEQRLLPALRREWGVTLAVDQRERLVGAGRRRLAVPDEQDVGGVRWRGEAGLAVLAGGHGPIVLGLLFRATSGRATCAARA